MQRKRRLAMTRRTFLRSVAAGTLAVGAGSVRRSSNAFALTDTLFGDRPSQDGAEPAPQWDSVYRASLGTSAMGYAYAVAQNGQPIAGAGVNLSRSKSETANPSQPWTLDTLHNLFSISKAITAVGFMGLVARQGLQLLDTPFWSILLGSGRFPGTPADGVDSVTIRQVLTHHSGLATNPEEILILPDKQSVDQYLMQYLQKPLSSQPGSTYHYSNDNFTIIQVLYEILSGAAAGAYTQLIKDNVLKPMGLDTTHEITDIRDPNNEALGYSGPTDTRAGHLEPPVPLMAAGGWLGTASGALKFLLGVRSNAVLDPATRQMMFTQQLGWFADTSPYGPYYHKTGSGYHYTDSARSLAAQKIENGVAILPGGYDAVLFVNSPLVDSNINAVTLIAQAFGAPAPRRD